jgi:hypothetical protein
MPKWVSVMRGPDGESIKSCPHGLLTERGGKIMVGSYACARCKYRIGGAHLLVQCGKEEEPC